MSALVASDPYRYACPKGHRTVRRVGGTLTRPDVEPGFDCETCRSKGEGGRYDRVRDLKRDRDVVIGGDA
ncbi:MAG: hypothetical protein RI560_03440 [Natronomonas sp.]|uniref:hypothetical protein n=1 Tax=Natronomonas sp. TaxID=2184060 RepID=UPI00287085D4|nr:hypothetical protein [Natronomonas sp.]MDR9380712.1 hypothetical protein [Natronomonas sp.]MDR9431519.1 hypothetical protein [Natronomonas sp.]